MLNTNIFIYSDNKTIPMLKFIINVISIVLQFPQNTVDHLVCCVCVLVAFLQFCHQWLDRFQSIENDGEWQNVLEWSRCRKQPLCCCFSVSVPGLFLIILIFYIFIKLFTELLFTIIIINLFKADDKRNLQAVNLLQ